MPFSTVINHIETGDPDMEEPECLAHFYASSRQDADYQEDPDETMHNMERQLSEKHNWQNSRYRARASYVAKI